MLLEETARIIAEEEVNRAEPTGIQLFSEPAVAIAEANSGCC
jgi:hypothetical protein